MKKPFLIVIDGPMGAGKTTVSKLLHEKLHKKKRLNALISLDKLKRIISGYERDSKIHLKLASDIGISMTKEYLKNNVDVIVEKAFTRAEFVDSFIKPFKKKTRLFVYQIEVPTDIGARRVRERPLHPEIKKRPPKSKFERNIRNYSKFKYKKAKVFDSNKLTPRQIVNQIMKDIK